MNEGLREKIQSICSNLCTASKPHECVTCNGVVDAILNVVVAEIPAPEKADNYASENADVYRAYDSGFKNCRDAMIKKLGRKE